MEPNCFGKMNSSKRQGKSFEYGNFSPNVSFILNKLAKTKKAREFARVMIRRANDMQESLPGAEVSFCGPLMMKDLHCSMFQPLTLKDGLVN